jgi:hypothetical protein
MSHWRVAQHYGFGAGRIPIQPEPHRAARLSLAAGLADVSADLASGGPLDMARRILGQSPAILLGLLLIATFVVTLGRDYSDRSPVEVVLFDSEPMPVELPPEPVPEPLLAEVVPEPVRVEEPKPLPAAEPPPTRLVERPKPVPPPPIERRAPSPPQMPQIARVEPIRPPPPPRRAAREAQPPRPQIARPRVAPDALAAVQRTESPRAPRRTQRLAAAAQPARSNTPRLDAPAAPDIAPERPPPARGFRVAAAPSAAPTRRPQAIPGLAPAPKGLDAPSPAAPTRSRSDAPRPSARARTNLTPALAAAVPTPSAEPESRSAAPRRVSRSAPVGQTARVPRPVAELARAPARPAVSVPAVTRRARPDAPEPQGASDSRPGLAGVPLGELSACVSDREEDRLKQAVVAAVTTQEECVSRAGTYRFIETKNLNSFLMWIDRASSRSVGDRCDELRYALECLQSASHRAAR